MPMLLPGPQPLAGGLVGDGFARTFVEPSLGEQMTGLLCAGLNAIRVEDSARDSIS